MVKLLISLDFLSGTFCTYMTERPIRLRAERRCGQLLKQREMAKAGRPPENRSHDATDYRGAAPLADLGISKTQSSRWQKLAEITEQEFEATFAGDARPTTREAKAGGSPHRR